VTIRGDAPSGAIADARDGTPSPVAKAAETLIERLRDEGYGRTGIVAMALRNNAANYIEWLRARIRELEAAQQWRPGVEAPTDGRHIIGPTTFRYLKYKPDGQRQMKRDGRWQRASEYGWENCHSPPEWWQHVPKEWPNGQPRSNPDQPKEGEV
jgi:hypothetical protein